MDEKLQQQVAGLMAAGKADQAVALLEPVCAAGTDADGHYSLAGAYGMLGRYADAERQCILATERDPAHALAWFRLANAVDAQGRFGEAEGFYRKSLELDPGFAHGYNNLGVTLMTLVRPDEAEQCYRKALALMPGETGFVVNLGLALLAQNDVDGAIDQFRQALSREPEHAEANWSLSLSQLLKGDYSEGWQRYHWRWLRERKTLRDYPQPLWQGEPIEGKTLLVWHEQGFGDSLQFCRYLKLLGNSGARVVVEIQKELLRLFEGVDGIDVLLSHGSDLPAFDVHIPMASLAGLYSPGIDSVPAEVPYIHSTHENPVLRERIAAGTGRKIGLVWSGSQKQLNDRRPCPLDMFEPLSSLDNVSLFSLRVGEITPHERELMTGMEVVDLVPEISDFADTAVAIESLDLVITIDTAVAHLAGALGKPVWILLPFSADWRWGLQGAGSRWYPSARLFRQPRWGQWQPVFESLLQELKTFVGDGL